MEDDSQYQIIWYTKNSCLQDSRIDFLLTANTFNGVAEAN